MVSPSTALFPFPNMRLHRRPGLPLISRPHSVSLLPHGALQEVPLSFVLNFSLAVSHLNASRERFPFLSVTSISESKCLHRGASRAITGCLSSSLIPLLLSEVSLPSLRVTLIHFAVSSYEWAFRLPSSYPISDLASLE